MRRLVGSVAVILVAGGFHLSSPQAIEDAAASTGPIFAQGTSPGGQTTMTPSEKEAQSRLERAGYTQVRDVRSGPEGITAKAVKDGKEVSVVVDSGGRIKESPARP